MHTVQRTLDKAYYNEDRFSHDSICEMKPSQIWKKKKGRQYMEESSLTQPKIKIVIIKLSQKYCVNIQRCNHSRKYQPLQKCAFNIVIKNLHFMIILCKIHFDKEVCACALCFSIWL
jgi:hypothetical protein